MCVLQDFLESEGIIVNEPEGIPGDPYIAKRTSNSVVKTSKTQSSFDKLRQFKELDRKVLRFYCVWNDSDNMFGEVRPFILHVSMGTLFQFIVWLSALMAMESERDSQSLLTNMIPGLISSEGRIEGICHSLIVLVKSLYDSAHMLNLNVSD